MHFGYHLKEQIIQTLGGRFTIFKGTSQSEIDEVIKDQKVSHLPRVYLEYLEVFGESNAFQVYFDRTDSRCWELMGTKEELVDDIEYYGPPKLGLPDIPADAFIFHGYNGVYYLYFLTDPLEDDPPVFEYMPGEFNVQVYDKLSDFYLELFEHLKRWNKNLKF